MVLRPQCAIRDQLLGPISRSSDPLDSRLDRFPHAARRFVAPIHVSVLFRRLTPVQIPSPPDPSPSCIPGFPNEICRSASIRVHSLFLQSCFGSPVRLQFAERNDLTRAACATRAAAMAGAATTRRAARGNKTPSTPAQVHGRRQDNGYRQNILHFSRSATFRVDRSPAPPDTPIPSYKQK
jgi:hypothetical protein